MTHYFIIYLTFLTLAITSAASSQSEQVGRIVNGKPAARGQFPWAVRIYKTSSNFYSCSGTIINEQWILTAASCISGEDNVTVAVGSIILDFTGDGDSIVLNSTKLYPHPRFDKFKQPVDNNIGLIKLSKALEFNERIEAVELASEYLKAAIEGQSAGWGYKSVAEPVSSQLQFLKFVTIAQTVCENSFPGYITSNAVCGKSEDKTGICRGDLGAGFVLNPSNKPLLVGVASYYSETGCDSWKPAVFTRVSVYKSWIQDTIEKDRANGGSGVRFCTVLSFAIILLLLFFGC